MEAVTLDTLRAVADSLAADAKSLERRARYVKQQAAVLRDGLQQLQSDKEDTSEQHEQE